MKMDSPLLAVNVTTTQRNAMTPANGDIIYNTTLGVHQGYQGGRWFNIPLIDGWMPESNTWTYSSVDGHTSVATVNADITGYIGLGDRIKLTNNSRTQYFIVTKISFAAGTTTVTMYGGAVPVILNTSYANAGGARTSVSVVALKYPIASGTTVRFANGDTTTLSSAGSIGDTSLSLTSSTPSTTNGGWWISQDINVGNYWLANSAITNVSFSHLKSPVGFNVDPDLWTERLSESQTRSQTNPTLNTWYNLGSLQLAVPIGVWRLRAKSTVWLSVAAADATISSGQPSATLSTANNAVDDNNMSGGFAIAITSASQKWNLYGPYLAEKNVALLTKTTFYLLALAGVAPGANSTLNWIAGGLYGNSSIYATSAYL